MPYYGAGDYYQAGGYYRGDNYQAGENFFKKIGKGLKSLVGGVASTALSLTPAGAVVKALVPSLSQSSIASSQGPRPMIPVPGLTGTMQRLVPGGASGYMLGRGGHRRMNVTNVKALRRAGRRVRGFLKIARRLGALPVASGKGKRLFKVRRKK